jgi:YVTN family beta-propeller protein
MGSRNLVIIDANGNRVTTSPIQLGDGPTGLALDESRQRLYVLNRFSATLSVLDTTTLSVVTNVSFFDPTPLRLKQAASICMTRAGIPVSANSPAPPATSMPVSTGWAGTWETQP